MDNVEKLINEIREKRKIKLVGKCMKCGKCCEGTVKIYKIIPNETVKLIRRENKSCIYYDEKTKNCKDYSKRCSWCYMFPYLPENLYEGCGYHFESINEEEENKLTFEEKFIQDTKEEISKLNYKKYFYQYSDKEKIVLAKEMKNIINFFEKELELAVYPVYGTLLGMIRNNDFIGHDTDIDMAYLSKCQTEKAVLNEFNMICKFLEEKKLLMYRIKTASHLHVFSPNKHLRIDLWISWIDKNNNYHLVWTVGGDIDSSMILPFKTIKFKGQIFRQMNNPERFLNIHYGNWNVTIGGEAKNWNKRKFVFELEPWNGK